MKCVLVFQCARLNDETLLSIRKRRLGSHLGRWASGVVSLSTRLTCFPRYQMTMGFNGTGALVCYMGVWTTLFIAK